MATCSDCRHWRRIEAGGRLGACSYPARDWPEDTVESYRCAGHVPLPVARVADVTEPKPFTPKPPTGKAYTCRACGAPCVDDGKGHTQNDCIAHLRGQVEALKAAGRAVLQALPRCCVNLDTGVEVGPDETDAPTCTDMATHWAVADDQRAVDGFPCCEAHRSMWLRKPDFAHAAPAQALAALVKPEATRG